MKNLAGLGDADKFILEELYLAGIPKCKEECGRAEVPYSYVGICGDWKFKRAWSYWIAKPIKEPGLILSDAEKLYWTINPVTKTVIGNEVRAGGDAGCKPPNSYVAQPIYDEAFKQLIRSLGTYPEITIGDESHPNINNGEIARLCNLGIINVNRYVNVYHIDTQMGLKVFADFIKNL